MTKIFARVGDQNINELPKDLYIDPEALLVFLEIFEGPLDLLLYLIRKQNIDILNIPIAKITDQYIAYIDAMQVINIDLAAEYLAMAATLISIKSRMMLPRQKIQNDDINNEDIGDPRVQLINQLIEYEKIKLASQNIHKLPMAMRDYQWVNIDINSEKLMPQIMLDDLKKAWQNILLKTMVSNKEHHIAKSELSVREFMSNILKKLSTLKSATFQSMFEGNQSIPHIVINFIAILELTKEGLIRLETQHNDIVLVLIA